MTETSKTSNYENTFQEEEHIAHIVPWQVLLYVWAVLMVLTYFTVLAVKFNLGALNLWIAMGIATLKATLVALYFMHLRYERAFYSFVFIASLFFVLLFVGLALMDTISYHPELIPGYAPGVGQ